MARLVNNKKQHHKKIKLILNYTHTYVMLLKSEVLKWCLDVILMEF
jgi:hypothetical protein